MTHIKTPYPAPDFSLADEAGDLRSLADYKGRWLVLYFYPKDDTPGCTVEACSMRDTATDLDEIKADVVGVSADDAASHVKFKAKYHLNFPLLSDPDMKVINDYGAYGKKMFGKEGILRKTFIINPHGQVVKVYGKVTPLGHGEQVAELLKKLQ